MISTFLCAVLLAQAPAQNTLPFAWDRAVSARVEVKEIVSKIPFEYEFDFKVFLDGDGVGVVLKQSNFDLKAVANLDLTKAAAQESMREWIVQKNHIPTIRASEVGAFEEFTDSKKVEAAFFKEITAGYNPMELKAAQLNLQNPVYNRSWFSPLRMNWYRWSELWTGLSSKPGVRSSKRRAFLNLDWVGWMDVVSEVEVSERFMQDGREVIRVQSQFAIDDQAMGQHWLTFMRSLRFAPTDIFNLQSYEVVYRDTAIFDTETWLPLEIVCKVDSTMAMKTSRAEWEENAAEEFNYRFDWKLRETAK